MHVSNLLQVPLIENTPTFYQYSLTFSWHEGFLGEINVWIFLWPHKKTLKVKAGNVFYLLVYVLARYSCQFKWEIWHLNRKKFFSSFGMVLVTKSITHGTCIHVKFFSYEFQMASHASSSSCEIHIKCMPNSLKQEVYVNFTCNSH